MAFQEIGLDAVLNNVPDFTSGIDKMNREVDGFAKNGASAGKEFESGFGDKIGGAIKNVAAIAAGIGAAGFLALGKAVFDGVGSAQEAAQLLAQTNAAIESTGGAAGKTADQITDLATSLSAAKGKSLFGDSDIQMAENLLLTFTNINGAVFDAATTISVDMAQALGGAPKDQAIALGKALNDPVKGITALTRVGVTFTDEQKAQIQAMQEAGDTAGAQTIILNELNKEFGGSAAAAAAADGGWAQFKDTMGELEESVGAAILPLLNELVGVLNDKVVPVVTAVVDAFGGVIEAFQEAGGMSSEFGESLGYLGEQLGLPGDLIADIVFNIQDFVKWVGDLISVFAPADDTITDASNALAVLGGATGDTTKAISPLQSALNDLNGVWQLALKVISDVASGYLAIVQAVLPVIQRFIADHGAQISAFFKTTWDSIIQIITLALKVYDAIVPPILQAIAGFIKAHGDEIQKVLSGVWTIITSIITGALETIKGVLKLALDLIHGDWEAAWKDVQAIGKAQWDAITGALTGFLNAIAGIFNTSLSDIVQLWKDNWDNLVSIVSRIDWAAIGQGAVDGIIQGIRDNASALLDTVKNLINDAIHAALKAAGIESPATEFMPVGEFSVQGIMAGFQNMWPSLMSLVNDLGGDLVDQAQKIAKDVQAAMADAFGATASIDRQKANNIRDIGKISAGYQPMLQQQINAAEQEALAMADPQQAKEWFALRSKQLISQAKLNEELQATTDIQGRARLMAQYQLNAAANTAEIQQFQANAAQGGGGISDIVTALQNLLMNPNMPGIIDNPLIARLQGVLGALRNPPAGAGQVTNQGSTTNTTNTQNFNMPIYTNQSPSVMQDSMAMAQAVMW